MIRCTKNKKCNFSAFDNLSLEASSDGLRCWMVKRKRRRRRRSKEEKLETTVAKSSIKLCLDCRTSITPLWRSGPEGPTSLCNACGIRYSKRKRSDSIEEAEARKMSAMNGNREIKPNSNAEETKKVQKEKHEKLRMELSEEELRRRQKEKQEKILMVLLRHRCEAKSRRKWESEEIKEAALLLLSLSCAIPVYT